MMDKLHMFNFFALAVVHKSQVTALLQKESTEYDLVSIIPFQKK